MVTIALLEPQIPPNTGNIARLAVGLDIPLILIGPLGFSIDNKQVRRAGLDYWNDLKLSVYQDWKAFLQSVPEQRIVMATTKGTIPYFEFDYHKDDILLFGSETSGLPEKLLLENSELTVTIPMPGNVRSINLSNSVSVVSYHALHRLGYFHGFNHNRNIKELSN